MCPPSLVFFGTKQRLWKAAALWLPVLNSSEPSKALLFSKAPHLWVKGEREGILEGLFKDLEVVVVGVILHPLLCCVDPKGRDGTYVLS